MSLSPRQSAGKKESLMVMLLDHLSDVGLAPLIHDEPIWQ